MEAVQDNPSNEIYLLSKDGCKIDSETNTVVVIQGNTVKIGSIKDWSNSPRTFESSHTLDSLITCAALSQNGLHLAICTTTSLFLFSPHQKPSSYQPFPLSTATLDLKFSCTTAPLRKQSVSDQFKQQLQASTPYLSGLTCTGITLFSLQTKPQQIGRYKIQNVLAYCFQEKSKNTLYYLQSKAVCRLLVKGKGNYEYSELWRPAELERLRPVAIVSGGDSLFVGGFYDGKKTMVWVMRADGGGIGGTGAGGTRVQRITLELWSPPRSLMLQYHRATKKTLLITTSKASMIQLLQADQRDEYTPKSIKNFQQQIKCSELIYSSEHQPSVSILFSTKLLKLPQSDQIKKLSAMPPPPLVKEFTFSEEQKTIERRMTFGKVAESPPPTEINKKEQQYSVERVNEIREKIRKIGIIIESYQRDVKMERLSLVDIENWQEIDRKGRQIVENCQSNIRYKIMQCQHQHQQLKKYNKILQNVYRQAYCDSNIGRSPFAVQTTSEVSQPKILDSIEKRYDLYRKQLLKLKKDLQQAKDTRIEELWRPQKGLKITKSKEKREVNVNYIELESPKPDANTIYL